MKTFSINKDIYKGYELLRELGVCKTEIGNAWVGELYCKEIEKSSVVEYRNITKYGSNKEWKEKRKKENEYYILTQVEEESYKGVREEELGYQDRGIEELIENGDKESKIEEFLEMREYLIQEIELDIWYVLEKVLDGNKLGLKKMKEIVEEFEIEGVLRDIIKKPEYLEGVRVRIE